MADKFLKLVKGAAAAQQNAQRAALEYKVKAGKKKLLRALTNYAGSVIDTDPADFVSDDSRLIPMQELPEELRRLCTFTIGEDGVVYAVPPNGEMKLQFAALLLKAIATARDEGISLSETAEEADAPEPFIMEVHPAEPSAGAKMIAAQERQIEAGEMEDAANDIAD